MHDEDLEDEETTPRRRFRLIPITVTMLTLLLVVRVNEVYLNSRQLREFYGVRDASASGAPKEEAKAEEKPAEEGHGDAAKEGEKPAEGGHGGSHGSAETEKKDKPPVPGVDVTYGTSRTSLKDIEALKAKEGGDRYSKTELDLLENLAKRRDELDQREKELEMKSSVLDATEKRINDKVGEMKLLQTELTKVVAQYNEQQDTQIKSLVKIYESMKPSDAANIFNELDMPILLEVIDKMSERKVALVLAGMDPKKARDVTQELAEMRRSVNKAGNPPATLPKP